MENPKEKLLQESSTQPSSNNSSNYGSLSSKSKDAISVPDDGFGWIWGSFLLLNATAGFGAIALPAAVQRTDNLAVGFVIQAIVMAMLISSLLVVGYVSTIKAATFPTYQSIFRFYFGPWMELFVSVLILLNMYVACLSYCVAIRDQFGTLIQANSPLPASANIWYMNSNFLMFAICFVTALPFTLLPKIDYLRQASALASICVLYLIGIAIASYAKPEELLNNGTFTGGRGSIKPKESADWVNAFNAIGTFVSAYAITSVAPPIYARMRPHTFGNFVKLCLASYGLCIILYNLLIVFSILAASGTDLHEDVLLDLKPTHPAVIICYSLYALKLCLQYAVIAYVGREAVITLLPSILYSRVPRTFVRISISVIWFVTTILLAIEVPEVITAAQMVSFMASPLGVLLPGLTWLRYLKIYPPKNSATLNISRFGAVCTCVIGTIFCALSLVQTIVSYVY